MFTHFPNRIPTDRLYPCYVIDGYYTQTNDLKIEKIKEIYDNGFRSLYISLGHQYNMEMVDYIKSLTESNMELLKDVEFNFVIIDSINMAHASIAQLIPSELYIVGMPSSCMSNISNEQSWGNIIKSPYADKNSDEYYFVSEFLKCSKVVSFITIRKYYKNQIYIKQQLKGPFKNDTEYYSAILKILDAI
jgi:hypothetical protein